MKKKHHLAHSNFKQMNDQILCSKTTEFLWITHHHHDTYTRLTFNKISALQGNVTKSSESNQAYKKEKVINYSFAAIWNVEMLF